MRGRSSRVALMAAAAVLVGRAAGAQVAAPGAEVDALVRHFVGRRVEEVVPASRYRDALCAVMALPREGACAF